MFKFFYAFCICFFCSACNQSNHSGEDSRSASKFQSKTLKYPRCAGSYEFDRCIAQEEILANEPPEAVITRSRKLDEERKKNMDAVASMQNSDLNSDTAEVITSVTTNTDKKNWYVRDINRANCFQSEMSPADRIRDLQSWGEFAKVNEAPNGSVEVGHETSQGFKYWTYYKSLQSCIDSLPRSKQIPSKYE